MNHVHLTVDPRAEELLADQAITGLDQLQAQELMELLAADASRLQDEFMHTAALVQLGMLSQEPQRLTQMPDHLRARILAAAPQIQQPAGQPATAAFPTPTRPQSASRKRATFAQPSWIGWAVAAGLAVALIVRVDTGGGDLAEQRAKLINESSDLVRVDWTKPDDPQFSGVTGDVVWSDNGQTGFLRLSGMPANDPLAAQYQLWIVDPERSAQPVDGGIFNVQASNGEVIVPIHAKLAVDDPAAFAITLEKPGGVVVSAGPLLVVAAVGS